MFEKNPSGQSWQTSKSVAPDLAPNEDNALIPCFVFAWWLNYSLYGSTLLEKLSIQCACLFPKDPGLHASHTELPESLL